MTSLKQGILGYTNNDLKLVIIRSYKLIQVTIFLVYRFLNQYLISLIYMTSYV